MKKSVLFALVMLGIIGGAPAKADLYNLQTLMENQGTITIGDKTFADFSWYGGAVSPSGDYTLEAAKGSAGSYSLTLHGTPSEQAPFVAGILRYTVSTTSGKPLITGIGQSLTHGGIIASVAETIHAGGFGGITIGLSLLNTLDLTDPPAEAMEILEFSGQSKIGVYTYLFGYGESAVGPFSLTQSFNQAASVPEGGVTAAFLAAGLCGMYLARRYRVL